MQSVTVTTDKSNRLGYKNRLLSKVEAALTPSIDEPEFIAVEIIEKYADQPLTVSQQATRLFRPVNPDYAVPGVEKKIELILESDTPKRVSFKDALAHKIEALVLPTSNLESKPIEIIESYSPWRSFEPIETIPLGIKEEKKGFILDRDVPKRVSFKDILVSRIEHTINPPVLDPEPEPAKIEIIQKYANGLFRAIEPMEEFDPEVKEEATGLVLTSDISKRVDFKENLFCKVEESLLPLPLPQDPGPIEIIEKYSQAVRPLIPSMETIPPPVIKETNNFFTDSDIPKRTAFKDALVQKVEEALVPLSINLEPESVEIIETYSPWRSFEPIETIPLGITEEKDTGFISPGDVSKRTSFKNTLIDKVEEALAIPAPKLEPEPIEIIEAYSPWRSFESMETIPPGVTEEKNVGFISLSDAPKRASFKDALVHKVEETLTPILNVELEPIEIIEAYSPWRSFESMETIPPIVSEEKDFILDSDAQKRASFKDSLVHKVEETLAPIPELRSIPIEILESYTKGLSIKLVVEPMDELLPEFKKDPSFIPHREIFKRQNIKFDLLNKVTTSLTPIPFEPELELKPVEIVQKYTYGIPKQTSFEPINESILEVKELDNFVLDSDIPKRHAFKDTLLDRTILHPVEQDEIMPVEIVDYSQRSISPLGHEFPEVKLASIPIINGDTSTASVIEPVVKETTVPVLRLPNNYKEFDEKTLYGILVRSPYLKHTSETANLTLDVLNGRSAQEVKFRIIIEDKILVEDSILPVAIETVEIQDQFKVQDIEKRAVFMDNLVDRIEKLPTQLITVKESIKLESIDLPDNWEDIPLSVLRTDLLSNGSTPEQVDILLASLVKIDIPVQDTDVKNTDLEELSINLPKGFKLWKSQDQYTYLIKNRKLIPELANKIIYNVSQRNIIE